MPDHSRWRSPAAIREYIDSELTTACAAVERDPWPALERAHVASQPWAWQHVRVHATMLRTAWHQRDRREITGQLIRLAVAAPGSLTGRYPTGNTGRTTMGLTDTAPIPADLRSRTDVMRAIDRAAPPSGPSSMSAE